MFWDLKAKNVDRNKQIYWYSGIHVQHTKPLFYYFCLTTDLCSENYCRAYHWHDVAPLFYFSLLSWWTAGLLPLKMQMRRFTKLVHFLYICNNAYLLFCCLVHYTHKLECKGLKGELLLLNLVLLTSNWQFHVEATMDRFSHTNFVLLKTKYL